MKRIVFLGPPGAGKGTQAKLLASSCALLHISTGDMLRAAVKAGTELGRKVAAILDAGQLVPDDVMIEIIKERIAQQDASNGYILDGFPRTLAQAEALQTMLGDANFPLTHAILFEVSSDDVLGRLSNRRGVEDRADDAAEVQLERLRVYEEQTRPLVDFYQKIGLLTRVSGAGSIDDVAERVTQAAGG